MAHIRESVESDACAVCTFVIEEEFDSEGIEADPVVFAQNVAVAIKADATLINGIKH